MADLTWHRIDSDGTVSFSKAVPLLRALYENGAGFDVELIGTAAAGEDSNTLRSIRAHKWVLMHASKHLHELFTADDYTDSHQIHHKFTEIGHESLNDIVKFIYTNELIFQRDSASERIQKVLIGAKFLVMPDLANACETYLASDKHLNMRNCLSMFRFARKYTCLSLLGAVLNLTARNLTHGFIDRSDFLKLSEEEVGKLLMSEPVITHAGADQRCRAAVAWLNHDRPARGACVSDILNMVPFDLKTISLDTLAAAGINSAIRTQYAEKFMDVLFDGVNKYRRNADQPDRCHASMQTYSTVSDVWWNASSSSARDMWYVMGGLNAPDEFATYDVARRFWSKLPNLPWTRTGAGASIIGGKTVFLFGGERNNERSTYIDQYDLTTNKWTTNSTRLSTARTYTSACAIGRRAHNKQSIFVGTRDSVERLNFSEGTWNGKLLVDVESMPGMLVGRYHATPVYASNAVFVAGGVRDSNESRLASIEKYDCAANKWSTVGYMGWGRSSYMAAVFGDDLYLAGGYDGSSGVETVEVFNTRTGQIRRAPNMLSERCGGAGVALDNNTFCVVGGGVGYVGEPCLRRVECFDVREGKWSTASVVPDMPTANRNFGFAYV